MRFAAIQFDIRWEDKPANHIVIERMMDDAAIEPDTFVLLPELGDTGFSFDLDAIVDNQTMEWAMKTARERKIWIQAGYATRDPRSNHPTGRNNSTIISPAGEVIGTYQKLHPFSYGRESEYYGGGDHLLIADCSGVKVAPLICYDLRFPELWRLAALSGAEVFTIGASWPAARQHHWRALLIARAIENQAYVVAVNRVGNDPHLSYAGGSIIIDPRGSVLAEPDPADQPCALSASLDMQALREWRAEFPALADVRRELLGEIPEAG